MPDANKITAYLDRYLKTATIADWGHALNGLQVGNEGEVTKIVAAVDACEY